MSSRFNKWMPYAGATLISGALPVAGLTCVIYRVFLAGWGNNWGPWVLAV